MKVAASTRAVSPIYSYYKNLLLLFNINFYLFYLFPFHFIFFILFFLNTFFTIFFFSFINNFSFIILLYYYIIILIITLIDFQLQSFHSFFIIITFT